MIHQIQIRSEDLRLNNVETFLSKYRLFISAKIDNPLIRNIQISKNSGLTSKFLPSNVRDDASPVQRNHNSGVHLSFVWQFISDRLNWYVFLYCSIYTANIRPCHKNTDATAKRRPCYVHPCYLCISRNTDNMKFCSFCGNELLLDRSSSVQRELCNSDKILYWWTKRIWSRTCFKPYVYILFLRDSNVILSVIEFLSDGRYRMQFHNFRPRIFEHLHSLVNFLWLVVTATVNLHSIANWIAFHNFWTHKSDRSSDQFLTLIWADSISEHSAWYFWHFCQYLKEVSDIWMPVNYLFLPLSLIFTGFNDMSFVCVHLNA